MGYHDAHTVVNIGGTIDAKNTVFEEKVRVLVVKVGLSVKTMS